MSINQDSLKDHVRSSNKIYLFLRKIKFILLVY